MTGRYSLLSALLAVACATGGDIDRTAPTDGSAGGQSATTGGTSSAGGGANGGAGVGGGAGSGGTTSLDGSAGGGTGGTDGGGAVDGGPDGAATGGLNGTGGTVAGGTAGATTTGGVSSTGGASTGGMSSTGGASTGGASSTGGATTGGVSSTGGAGTGGAVASCTNGIVDGTETDVDCGGSCGPCGPGRICVGDGDCAVPPCDAGHCAEACPTGQFVAGVDAAGDVQCATLASVAGPALNSSCSIYLGWRDSCDGCTTDPAKWGTTSGTTCANGTGSNGTCTAPTLGGRTVNLFGVNPDGDVDDNDKFYTAFHCIAPAASTSSTSSLCPAGQLAVAVAQGSVSCASVGDLAAGYARANCSLYFGYRDSCDGCTTDPFKWGRVNDTICENGTGVNDTCTTPTLGGQSLQLFGINTDGNVNGDDKFYVGLHCGGATASGGTVQGTCPAGQFVTGVASDGSVSCTGASTAIETYVRQSCFVYLGWRDSCNGCTNDPTKWGRASDTTCENGAGTDDTCTSPTLGGQTVTLFGLNTDGDVGDDDKLYVGFRCE